MIKSSSEQVTKQQIVVEQNLEEIQISDKKRTKVLFQFLHYPEYLNQNSYLFIDENNIKVFGLITQLFYDTTEKFNCNALGNKEQRLKNKKSRIMKEKMSEASKSESQMNQGSSEVEKMVKQPSSFKNKEEGFDTHKN